MNASQATASFDVSGLPRGGKNSYDIFDASYQLATDGHIKYLRRNGNLNGVEIDWNNAITNGNTRVSPVTFQKAAEVSASVAGEYFSGSAAYAEEDEFILNFWVSGSRATFADNTARKFLYNAVSSADRNLIQVYFNSGSFADSKHLIIRRYVSPTSFYEYHSDSAIVDDGGLDWTMFTIMAYGGVETKLYVNATASSLSRYDYNSPGTDFTYNTVNKHYVMHNYDDDSKWTDNARIRQQPYC